VGDARPSDRRLRNQALAGLPPRRRQGLCLLRPRAGRLALQLQAVREGLLNAHPIAGYSPAKAAKAVELPEDLWPWPWSSSAREGRKPPLRTAGEGEKAPRQRKPLSEVAFRNRCRPA